MMTTTKRLQWLLGTTPKGFLAILALLLAPALTAVAHDYDKEDEEEPDEPDTTQIQFEEDFEPEEEEKEHGYDSAKEAAEAFLRSLKENDTETMKKTVPPEEHEEFERVGKNLVEAVELQEYEITSVEVDEEEQRATATYTWDLEIDKDHVVEGYTEVIRQTLRDEGLTEEEIEQILAVEMEPLRADLHAQMEELEKEENRMTLEQIDGRWYVTSPVDEDHELKQPEELEEELDHEEWEERDHDGDIDDDHEGDMDDDHEGDMDEEEERERY